MADSWKNPRTDIPNHLIFQEIIPRIPAKSLRRFKSVCHEWNSVISSVNFTSRSVLTVSGDGDLPLEAVEFYGDVIIDSNRISFGDNIKIPFFLVSSCNGLAFMITFEESVDNSVQLPDDLHLLDFSYVVFNPVLGADHFVEIPHPEEYRLANGDQRNSNYNFGFGYVSSTDDYYIVAIDSPRDSVIDVYTYSLRSQQWNDRTLTLREEQEEAALPLKFLDVWYCQIAVLAKRALHWGMLRGKDDSFIFAYDLVGRQQCRLIDLPYRGFGAHGRLHSEFRLSCLDDCLCAWATDDKNVIEMWMMKERRGVESWEKLFRLQMHESRCCRKIFGFTKPDMVLLFNNIDELVAADFSCDLPRLSKPVLYDRFEAVSYAQSSVSVFALISDPIEYKRLY